MALDTPTGVLLLLLAAVAMAAPPRNAAAPPPPIPANCSPKKDCDFLKAAAELNVSKPVPITLTLICTPEEKCTISGTTLGDNMGFCGGHSLVMQNVLIQNNTNVCVQGEICGSALLTISGGGSVNGTNLTFRNGKGQGAGAVFNDHLRLHGLRQERGRRIRRRGG